MKYFELAVMYIFFMSVITLTGYLLKDSNKVQEGIKHHLIERGIQ